MDLNKLYTLEELITLASNEELAKVDAVTILLTYTPFHTKRQAVSTYTFGIAGVPDLEPFLELLTMSMDDALEETYEKMGAGLPTRLVDYRFKLTSWDMKEEN